MVNNFYSLFLYGKEAHFASTKIFGRECRRAAVTFLLGIREWRRQKKDSVNHQSLHTSPLHHLANTLEVSASLA